jgi:hypothetical protein
MNGAGSFHRPRPEYCDPVIIIADAIANLAEQKIGANLVYSRFRAPHGPTLPSFLFILEGGSQDNALRRTIVSIPKESVGNNNPYACR